RITIDTSWTHEQVTQQLRAWFPKVFQYIDSWQECINGPTTQPDWQLLDYNCGKLCLANAVRPTGTVLTRFKGRHKVGVNKSNLWFGTHL
ncbi:hypothetical protein EDC04DRAFT_2534111, partial [Pisolithus marmoratus]